MKNGNRNEDGTCQKSTACTAAAAAAAADDDDDDDGFCGICISIWSSPL